MLFLSNKSKAALLAAVLLLSTTGCIAREPASSSSSDPASPSSAQAALDAKQPPITDKYIALDLAMDYLELEGYEKFSDNDADGYTYMIWGDEFLSNGERVLKKSGEEIFLISRHTWDIEALFSPYRHRAIKEIDYYGVTKSTGEVKPVDIADCQYPESTFISDKVQLPIVSEFMALDLVKDHLKLDDYEQIYNNTGGYTYEKGLEYPMWNERGQRPYSLSTNGKGIFKKNGEIFFAVSHYLRDEELLKKNIATPPKIEHYAVLVDTGEVRTITPDDIYPYHVNAY